MNFKTKIFLILIVLISFLIRFYDVKNYPSLLWDEAALGYNAYSISTNLRDEYGQKLPIIFKSFGDYKPGFYVYLAVPFIKILGLNEVSVRLPSIVLGSLLPLFVFLLITTISKKSEKLGIICAFLIAFNPYNIHYSRMAWETNILTVEIVLALFFFFKYINSSNKRNLILSSLFFGTTLFTYQAGKMISFFLILVILGMYFRNIKNNLKIYLTHFIFPLFLFTIPIIYGLLFSSNANRLGVVSVFSYPRSQNEKELIINESNSLDFSIFHNDLVSYSRTILFRYFNHFSPNFLIFNGDWQSARHSAPYIGVILYPSLIFLVIGFFSIFKNNQFLKQNIFFGIWLILSPIPASLTRDTVQATRIMSFSIPLMYFVSLGILYFIKTIKYKKLASISVVFIYIISFVYYSDLYLNHMVKKTPGEFLYGYKQSIQYFINNPKKYDNIYITDFYGQPYIYYLFYSKYNPIKYQSIANLKADSNGDTGTVAKIDNIYFESTNWNKVKNQKNTLAIFSYDEILRQELDKLPDFKQKFKPIAPINNYSTFYAYEN